MNFIKWKNEYKNFKNTFKHLCVDIKWFQFSDPVKNLNTTTNGRQTLQ